MGSPLRIEVSAGVLVVRFPSEYPAASWAPFHGGTQRACAVVNVQVPRNGCGTPSSREDLFAGILARHDLPASTIGLMTAAEVADYTAHVESHGSFWLHAVATVGLTNARSVRDDADVPLAAAAHGTINLILATNALPGDAGRFQAIHIAAAAKAAALRDAGARSRKSGWPADLTGTDCIVVAASGEISEDSCGLHTVIGASIGRAVHSAVTQGIARALAKEAE